MKIFILFFFLISLIFASNTSLIKVEGMHCPLCTTAVKKAIKQLDGVENVSVRLNTKEVTVIYDEKVKIQDILTAIKTTSYEGVEISTTK
ncbi:MAG: heavy-metal-associated domain-containing protein [Aliarcobacter sp.]|nr:heavy-metal-associated domain-containing protein [Aliarcobacter sp.]MDX9961835.1 heavy metal-associated domain-containing protein [Aliarcobacter sp.]